MNPNFRILGDQPKKGDLDAILKRGEEYLRKKALDAKREALGLPVAKPSPKPVTEDLHYKHFFGPFDKSKEALESEGYEIISLEQMAMLRIKEGKDSVISREGNWTREGFIYVPKKGVYLTKSSPVITSAKKATECNRNGKWFSLTSRQVEKALADSCKVTNQEISTLRLSEEELTVYAFGKQAKAYGEFLKEAGIDYLGVCTADIREKPSATQAWLLRLHEDDRSALVGDLRELHCSDYWVSGVKPAGGKSK